MATADNVYWIDLDALPPRSSPSEVACLGRLAIMARPRAGDWLEDEVAGWKAAGIDRVVSLLEPDEVVELGLEAEAGLCGRVGIEFVSFHIADRGVPVSVPAAADLAQSVASALRGGKNVAIHCRAGIGRSAVIAACVMVILGWSAGDAFDLIATARGVRVPDTDGQRDWVMASLQRCCHVIGVWHGIIPTSVETCRYDTDTVVPGLDLGTHRPLGAARGSSGETRGLRFFGGGTMSRSQSRLV